MNRVSIGKWDDLQLVGAQLHKNQFTPEDLTTFNFELSQLTGVAYGGIGGSRANDERVCAGEE